jgi:tRNA (guanine-N7-)-methyltransferase
LLGFPDFVFSDGRETAHRGRWRDFFGARIGPPFEGRITFEIGCNDATLLASVAATYPATAFVGIDWKYRALRAAAGRVAAAGLRNVTLLHGRGQDIRRYFGDGELDEAWVFHPDPCDKPQELPNRLIAEPFLLAVHAVLRPTAESALIVKTDHRAYYESSLALAAGDVIRPRFALHANSADFWQDQAILRHVARRAFAGHVTPFEQRFRKRRKPIYYLEFGRRGTS